MIKVLKLQKGLLVIVLGVIAIITYAIMIINNADNTQYVLGFSGFLFILGSLMLIYPILTAKKNSDGIIQLDKDKAIAREEAENSEKND